MASNVSRSVAVAVACVTSTDGASTRAHFRNGSPIAARLTRNDPGTRFQKCRVNPRGCNNWPTVLPIKAALNQTFELLKTLSSPPFLWNRNSDNHVWQDGTGVPRSNAYLVRTDQRQTTGVWYAVDGELFGVGGCSGRYPSHPSGYIGRVCSRCYRKCGSYFLPYKLSYDTIRRAADFIGSDSAERRCS